MTVQQYDLDAKAIINSLPAGPRIAAIGSGTFRGRDSRRICAGIGVNLANIKNLVMITGGISGVGEVVGRSYFKARTSYCLELNTYQILPRGSGQWNYGITIAAGETMEDRREILGRLSNLYISIEGGPGTAHEAQVAQTKGATIIPVSRTGGVSKELYMRIGCPLPEIASEWQLLDDSKSSIEEACAAVLKIVEALIKIGKR